MSQPKLLTWNPSQQAIRDLLMGGMSQTDAAKQLNVSNVTVTKVANAMKKGQSPANPYVPKPKLYHFPPPKDPPANPPGDPPPNPPPPPPPPPPPAPPPPKAPAIDSTLLLLKPIPTNCALTPIMLNARYTAVTELKWPETISWEDFFDTCLVWLFRYWGWGLQGTYKLEDKDTEHFLKAASEKGDGDGHKDLDKATKLGKVILEIIEGPKGKVANS